MLNNMKKNQYLFLNFIKINKALLPPPSKVPDITFLFYIKIYVQELLLKKIRLNNN